MSDSMIERVAKALYNADPCEDPGEALDGFQVTPGGPIKWETLLECGWGPELMDDFREKARTAIAAMREPTEEVFEYALDHAASTYGVSSRDLWQAMIDGALKEEPKP